MDESSPLITLGARLRGQFERVRGERLEIERRWMKDLRQFKGVYDPEESVNMDSKRSKTFTRMTRIKVKSATARLMDLIFPAGADDNWDIRPTPNPNMAPDPQVMLRLMMALGRPPSEEELELEVTAEAKHRAEAMQDAIKDQLVEVQYRRIMKDVIQSGNLLGTGVIKGPLVNRVQRLSWSMMPDGSWNSNPEMRLTPFIEFVPLWEIYPDTSATHFSDARYIFQRVVTPRHQLLELARRPDFRGDIIRQYLTENKDTDVKPLPWEIELRQLGWNIMSATPYSKRYELLEYWGVLEAEDLINLGLEPPDGEPVADYWANLFILGHHVVKAELQPIEGVQLPYYAYYWDKDETSIFGEGIPTVMRDDQRSLNSAVRAMQDNAAICAGPQAEINVDLLLPDEDPRAIYPFRTWLRSGVGAEANFQAVRPFSFDSHTQEYLSMSQFFMNNIHEATIPSYMHGEATSKGSVGRTVGGLSLLMSAAQITFKDQLFSLDDGVTRPFIQAMYHWNMQFNPDPSVKGDFSIVVRGTSSLVAREIRAQNLEQFANSTLNPMDAPYIDRHELNKQRARVLELGDSIVLSKEQALLNQVINPTLTSNDTLHQPQPQQQQSPIGPPPGNQTPVGGMPQAGGDAGIPNPFEIARPTD